MTVVCVPRVQGSGFKIQGRGFGVQGSGFRVQGAGFRVQGAGRAPDGVKGPEWSSEERESGINPDGSSFADLTALEFDQSSLSPWRDSG